MAAIPPETAPFGRHVFPIDQGQAEVWGGETRRLSSPCMNCGQNLEVGHVGFSSGVWGRKFPWMFSVLCLEPREDSTAAQTSPRFTTAWCYISFTTFLRSLALSHPKVSLTDHLKAIRYILLSTTPPYGLKYRIATFNQLKIMGLSVSPHGKLGWIVT
jgi:hypothetical protein